MTERTLLDLPVPPKPSSFDPAGAPPGTVVDLDAYHADWVAGRPKIRPRVIVIHTNGASVESKHPSPQNWSNRAADNTHAHYNVNAPEPRKHLRSDLRGIGNSTPPAIEREYGEVDSSFWTLVIETADRGYNNGGGTDLGDFLYDHDEQVARILAYESIVWDIPLYVPDVWNGRGVVTHTAPWDGVFTIYKGKSCPGTTKKRRVLEGDILPRARQIRDAWTQPASPAPEIIAPEEDDDMQTLTLWRHPDYDETFLIGAAPALNVSPAVFDRYRALGVPLLVEAHRGMLEGCAKQAGLTQLTTKHSRVTVEEALQQVA